MLIDSHAHLQFKDFDEDREEVIKRTLDGGILCINVGTDLKMSESAIKLAEHYDGFWATVGLHPTDLSEDFNFEDYEKLAVHPKAVAIGECGFDYYRLSVKVLAKADATPESRVKQEKIFRAQVGLAKKVGKPLMLHCRPSQNSAPSSLKLRGASKSYSDDAYLDMLRVLKEEGGDKIGGNVHFFVGSKDIAEKFLEIGFSFSFSGVITITDMYDEVVKFLPLDSILIETDAPYAAPVPYRGKRNEPLYVREVAKRLAELREKSFEEIAEITAQNAKRVFNLKF
ncbi:MAG: TatD family hydrolase [Candidatus Niyogibacteria bacterium]|nr:MAG: TatD family hydrolase [Candidatus Niyogibacteria bacterium]